MSDAVGRSFAYAQQNSLEVARAVRDLVTGVSRAIFIFFITLMLAAYTMLTRERIVAFLPVARATRPARELRRAPRAHRQRPLRRRPRAARHLRDQRRPLGARLRDRRPEVLARHGARLGALLARPDLRVDRQRRSRDRRRRSRRGSERPCSCSRGSSAFTSSRRTCSTRRSWATPRRFTRCWSSSRSSPASTSSACPGRCSPCRRCRSRRASFCT